jgi:AraC-like DNA-binding protein
MQQSSVWLKRSVAVPQIELRCNEWSSTCYDLHTHAEYSFGLIDEGQALYQSGQVSHAIQVGDLVTIDANKVHACNPRSAHWSYRMLFIEATYLNQLFAETSQPLCFAQAYWRESQLGMAFNELFSSLVDDEPALVIESQLITCCANLWKQPTQTAQVIALAGLRRIKDLLQEQAQAEFSLQALSELAGLTPYQLVRHFKKAYGLPPHAFQLDQRIQQAKPLLRQGVSLNEIALELGFADQAHFQRHFKRRLALTPKTYQQQFIRS